MVWCVPCQILYLYFNSTQVAQHSGGHYWKENTTSLFILAHKQAGKQAALIVVCCDRLTGAETTVPVPHYLPPNLKSPSTLNEVWVGWRPRMQLHLHVLSGQDSKTKIMTVHYIWFVEWFYREFEGQSRRSTSTQGSARTYGCRMQRRDDSMRLTLRHAELG